MAWKQLNQMTLADALIHEHEAVKELDEMHELIDWKRIENQLININNKETGERAWPPLMMFKILLLQSFYNLSDPACEKQLARDLLFRRFVCLGLAESVPDHSTIWRFRNHLEELGLLKELFKEVNDQLSSRGLLIKNGHASIIDASVVEAKNKRRKKNAEGENTQDPEASYNTKQGSDGHQKTTYGFKAHINSDEDGFILAETLTTGKVHDSQVFEELLTGEESVVYADSAYKSKAHDELLENRGIQNGVLNRPYRNTPLSDEQKRHNRYASQVRYVVERTFAILKRYHGLAKAKYMGIKRNQARLTISSIAYNLKRAVSIQRASA